MREAPGAADHRHPAGMPSSYKLIADTKVSDVAAQSGKPGIGTGSLNRNYARRTGTPGAARSALPWQCGQYVLLASLPQCQQPPLQRQCQYGLFCPGTDISMQNFWRVPVPRRGAYPRHGFRRHMPWRKPGGTSAQFCRTWQHITTGEGSHLPRFLFTYAAVR